MTILTFPAIRGPTQVEWYLQGLTQQQENPFDGSVQTIAMPGSRWRGTASYTLRYADGQLGILRGFLASLGGMAGRFTYSPPLATRRTTVSIPGPVQIDGASQAGVVLNVKGLPLSANVFAVGDWLSWLDAGSRPQLHQIVANVVSNGSGQAGVPIAPPIRSAGADSASVEIVAPYGVFRLTSDDQGRFMYTGDDPMRATVSFEMIEAPRV